jgi:multiple sugar transport system substrate-binding protein
MTTKKKLSRRDILKLTGALGAGAVLASCAQAEEPTEAPAEEPVVEEEEEVVEEPEAKPVSGHVVVMHFLHEFTEDMVTAFEEENPGITVEVVDGEDNTRFYAMVAAGTPPDMYRLQAPSIPGLLARDLLYDVTPYFEASEMIDVNDLAAANLYYRAEGPLEIGTGKIYGMVKDFSPDNTIFANTALFADAGLSAPDDTVALTYDQVMELAEETTIFEGDRMLQYGYGYENGWVDRFWMVMLAESGQNLYTDDYSKIVISGNEDTMAIAKWYYDMAEKGVTPSPQNPSPAGWFGNDFTGNTAAMAHYGFWYSAMAESDDNRGNVMMLPAPTWTGTRNDPTVTATGAVVISATEVPDATFVVFEYYHAGAPAVDRAGSGWGVPAFKSWNDKIPQESDFQKQAFEVLKGELDLDSKPLQFNPFIGETVVSEAWSKYLDQALVGDITFEEMIAGVEEETNLAISEGIDRLVG